MKKTLVIAHRGASAYAPENTLASFKKALSMGADGIELDVHLTRDGHIVVIHDEQINRTSDGKGFVKDFTLEELRTLDFGSWFAPEFKGEHIPTLQQVMNLLSSRNVLLNIELKNGIIHYDGLEKKVVDLVREYKTADRTIISSFNHYSLLDVKKYDPGIKTGALYISGLVDPWEYAQKIHANAIHPLFYNIAPQIVKGCKEHGIGINTFTVDDVRFIKQIGLAGVDGIITNVPDTALQALKEVGIR